MHFMNPVPVMKLVEVINGFATDASVTQTIVDLSKQLGKVPCVVNDYPGFIANKILMPMINEAIYSLHEGIAGVEEIDTIMNSAWHIQWGLCSLPILSASMFAFLFLMYCIVVLEIRNMHHALYL